MKKINSVAIVLLLAGCAGQSDDESVDSTVAQPIKTAAGDISWGVTGTLGNPACRLSVGGGSEQVPCRFTDQVPEGDAETIRHLRICDASVTTVINDALASAVNRINLDVGSKISAQLHHAQGLFGQPVCDGKESIKVFAKTLAPQPSQGEVRVGAYYFLKFANCVTLAETNPGVYQACYKNEIWIDGSAIGNAAPGGIGSIVGNTKQVVRKAILAAIGVGQVDLATGYAFKNFSTSVQSDSRITNSRETCQINSLIGTYFLFPVTPGNLFSGNCN